jgi:hypothetical protein
MFPTLSICDLSFFLDQHRVLGTHPAFEIGTLMWYIRSPPTQIEVELNLPSLELEVDLAMHPLPPTYKDLTSSADVMLTLYEDGLTMDVRAGENLGRRSLEAAHVVRALERAFFMPTEYSSEEEKVGGRKGKVRMKLAGGSGTGAGWWCFCKTRSRGACFGGRRYSCWMTCEAWVKVG